MIGGNEPGGSKNARERILAASIEIAGREGLEALTTRLVARQAGVNLGLLHYYFESKESLVEETLARFTDEIFAASEVAVKHRDKSSTVDELTEMLAQVLELASRRPGLIFGFINRLLASLSQSVREGPLLSEGKTKAFPPALDRMAKMHAVFFEHIRPQLISQLGEDDQLVGRRAIQIFTSIFHPALFTPLPLAIFGVDLTNEQNRFTYVRAIVEDGLRPS